MKHRIAFLPEARAEIERIGRWWRSNRRENPRLFRQELHEAIALLVEQPEAGAHPEGAPARVRHIVLPRTQYFIYYQIDRSARAVLVLSVWHTSRGSGPPL